MLHISQFEKTALQKALAPCCHFTVGSNLKPFFLCGEGAQEVPTVPPPAPVMPPEPIAIPVVALPPACSLGLLQIYSHCTCRGAFAELQTQPASLAVTPTCIPKSKVVLEPQ